ncbi:DUF305 domain-containing protein [Pilimelia terevasa]|uniref:DUF305 domain-containing protein n=1 Tax=Pilimelia terevasa TaxID=53372 RepID=A0A8J3BG01_9ACTN|nr:DUF305 domain-containing protein [Pilimelia terevasa]GGK18742.1 DUF305 domain-containing protein [Pilimelia terevasa]
MTADPADTSRRAGWGGWRGTPALALMLVLGLLVGAAGGWLAPRLALPGENSAEAGFARDMDNHHAQAIEMALIAFRETRDAEVRSHAVDMAMAQLTEVGTMQTWLRQWGLSPTSTDAPMSWLPAAERHLTGDGQMPGMASRQELARLRAAQGRDLDVLFLQLMIRHHLGGIHMIDGVLARTSNAEVRKAAGTMRTVQDAEVGNLTRVLTRLGGAPLPAS